MFAYLPSVTYLGVADVPLVFVVKDVKVDTLVRPTVRSREEQGKKEPSCCENIDSRQIADCYKTRPVGVFPKNEPQFFKVILGLFSTWDILEQ